MADSKLSAYPVQATILATTKFPVLNPGNGLVTAGQIKQYASQLTFTSISANTIPLTYSIVGVAGNCTLPAATEPVRILMLSSAAGKIISTGLLPLDGVTFAAADASIDLVWFNDKWNILSNYGMTPGIL